MADWGRGSGDSRGRVGTWDAAARRRRALAWTGHFPDFGRAAADRLRNWAIADTGPGRLLPWLPVAFGLGIAIYFTADREPAWWAGAGLVALCCRHCLRRPAPSGRIPHCARLHGRCRGLCCRHAENRPGGASGPGAAGRQRRHRGLRRGARGARAHRPHRGARAVVRRQPHRAETRPGAGLGQERHRAAGRHLCDVPRAAQPAARTAAARRLRLRARSLFPGHRRDRLRAGRDQARGGAGAARPVAEVRRRGPGRARRHRRAHPRGAARRQGRHRVGADHRQARRHFGAGQRCHVCLKPRPCAVDLGLPHGCGGGRGVLRAARFAGAQSGVCQRPPDQEMGRARGADRRRGLSDPVWLRGGDPARLHHDCDRADRRHGRSAGADVAHARGGGLWRAAAGAAVGGASELPDVVCGDACADRRLRARPALDDGRRRHLARRPRRRCGAAARSSRSSLRRWLQA